MKYSKYIKIFDFEESNSVSDSYVLGCIKPVLIFFLIIITIPMLFIGASGGVARPTQSR